MTTYICTLSLHDALPIYRRPSRRDFCAAAGAGLVLVALPACEPGTGERIGEGSLDRKSTRLNSSHSQISYAVFCLKKKIIRATNSMSIRTYHKKASNT